MKTPPNLPVIGERVCLRGRPETTGTLEWYNPASCWSRVIWDDGVEGPKICHRYELVILKSA